MPFTQIKNGAPVVAIKLNNGTVGHFLFDTGTNYSMMTDVMAARLGLTGKPYLDEDGSVKTIEGRPATLVLAPLVQIGVLQFANLNFMVVREQLLKDLLEPVPDQTLDGIIGADFYYSIATLFDFPRREITIWSGGKLTNDDLTSIHMADSAPIGIEQEEHHAFYDAPVRINGREEIKLRIDTGAPYTCIPARLVRTLRLKPTAPPEEITTALGKIVFGRVTVKQLAIGPLLVDHAPLQYSVTEKNGWPPTLGLDLLKPAMVLLDAPGKKLYLKPTLPTTRK